MFGRGPEVDKLLARCQHQGITFLTGRPKIGKTWLLQELARKLSAELAYLVGYRESTGERTDLLLRCVADAYSRWLADASYGEQAKSLLDRHKDDLVGKAGKVVSTLLSKALSAGQPRWNWLTEKVPEAFAGLAELDRDLKSGGLKLPRLSYDQARHLVGLLAKLSSKPVVLILDAWEKVPEIEEGAGLLDSYLRHLSDWPEGHLFVSIRVEDGQHRSLQLAKELVGPDAELLPIPPMHLEENPAEMQRLLDHLRGRLGDVAATSTDAELLAWVDGYPGVVEWWDRQAVKTAPQRQGGSCPECGRRPRAPLPRARQALSCPQARRSRPAPVCCASGALLGAR